MTTKQTENHMHIDFATPPRPDRGRPPGQTPLGSWLTELRSHPGRWARWSERVQQTTTTNINNGSRSGIVAGEYQAIMRDLDAKRIGDLYVRYLGPVAAIVVADAEGDAVVLAASTAAVIDAAGTKAIQDDYPDNIGFSTPIACEVRWTTEDKIVVSMVGREVIVEAQELPTEGR